MRFFWNIAVLGVVLGAGLIFLPKKPITLNEKHNPVIQPNLPSTGAGVRLIAAAQTGPPPSNVEEARQMFEGVEVFPPRLRSDWDASRFAHLRIEGRFRQPAEGVEWEKSRRVIFFDGDRMRRAHEVWSGGIQKIVDGETGEVLFQRDRRIF